MANKDLFKQAIAEAKSIREAAIANAKEALEESLTPHLKDMLAAKLQEMEDSKVEEEVVNEIEEEIEETVEEVAEELDVEEGSMEDDEAMEEAEDDSEESEDEAEGDEEVEAEDEEVEVKDMEVEDLKDLIRDIIAQEMGDGGEEELDGADMDAGAEMEPAMDDMEADADDEIDLDELLAELESATNEEIEEEVTEEVEEEVNEEVVTEEEDNSELTEALATIETLQNQLQEVNLLNAKLMYVNKVFKANNLSESQKVNIIAAFDKAETVKEVKLVFETVSENVVSKKATKVNESKLGMASKPTGTTAAKPEVISEVSDAVKRMQKLAGII
jgi:hypothetical protein